MGWPKGKPRSDEDKKKIAEGQKGRTHSDETKAKMRAAKLGKIVSPETREKMREAARNRTPEHQAKITAAKTGKSPSPEARAKMSIAQAGRHPSPETVIKIRESLKGKNSVPLEERFWKHCNQIGECWIWSGPPKNSGYGMAYVGMDPERPRKAIYRMAHHVAWILTHGPIPAGMQVLHNCPGGDNRLCINPDHLWLGTQKDNVQDMILKGRAKFRTTKSPQ